MTSSRISSLSLQKSDRKSGWMALLRSTRAWIAIVMAAALPLAAQQSSTPLSAKQKFGFAVKNSFAPLVYPEVALIAGISQADNNQPSFGQGGEGYAKRFGLTFADQANGRFMTQALLPALLKQDPRYFRMGQGSFSKRLGYSVSRLWITRRDDGGRAVNFSAIGGTAMAAGISRVYYPNEERTVGKTVGNWGIQIGTTAAFYVVQEFWPDIRRKVFHK